MIHNICLQKKDLRNFWITEILERCKHKSDHSYSCVGRVHLINVASKEDPTIIQRSQIWQIHILEKVDAYLFYIPNEKLAMREYTGNMNPLRRNSYQAILQTPCRGIINIFLKAYIINGVKSGKLKRWLCTTFVSVSVFSMSKEYRFEAI